MSNAPNPFIWYDLMTTDMPAAEAYYRAVVGWDAQPSGQPGEPYTIFSAGAGPAAGLMRKPADAAGAPPMWMGYLGVDDVDAVATRVTAAGGSVHRAPQDIPGVGRFAVVADPGGAGFMLFRGSSTETPPTAPPGTPGHVGWRELHAEDGSRAFDFYAALFGWTKDEAIDMGPMGTYQLFAAGGDAVGGIMTRTPDVPQPIWLYYLTVEAIDAAVARATERGGRLVHGPVQVPGGSWIAQCIDPQGAMFALTSAVR